MADFLSEIVSLPTVIFTVGLGVVLVYWLLVIVGGVSDDVFGGEGGEGLEVGGGGGGGGPVSQLLEAMGFTAVPPTITASFVVLFGWFFSLVLSELTESWAAAGATAALLGIATAVVALVAASLLTSVVVRPLRRFFVVTPAADRRSFVGRLCRIRTQTVSGRFGQAELVDADGASLVVQVRADDGNGLQSGDWALIYAYDDEGEVFLVDRADPELAPG